MFPKIDTASLSHNMFQRFPEGNGFFRKNCAIVPCFRFHYSPKQSIYLHQVIPDDRVFQEPSTW